MNNLLVTYPTCIEDRRKKKNKERRELSWQNIKLGCALQITNSVSVRQILQIMSRKKIRKICKITFHSITFLL